MTTQVDFYLLADAVDKDRYACRIAGKAVGQGLKVFMRTVDAGHSQRLNKLLWTFSQNSFIPHAVADDLADGTGHGNGGVGVGDRYPVLISHTVTAAADLLISLTTDAAADHQKFTRIADLVAADPADKTAARARFRHYRDHGTEPNTFEIK